MSALNNHALLKRLNLRRRLLAAGVHLILSAAVAAAAAVLVFGLWYPGAFRDLAGGRNLFLLVTSVDVLIGPLLTFTVFGVAKPQRELRRDLAVIGALQLAALTYGLYTVYEARPVAMVFEVDRFRLVTASSVSLEDLPGAEVQFRDLSLTGPRLLGTRRPRAGDERTDAMFKGLGGVDIGSRPVFWQSYELSRADAVARSRPAALLLEHYAAEAASIREQLADMGADPVASRFLPVVARGDWVAVLNSHGDPIGYLPFDGFF